MRLVGASTLYIALPFLLEALVTAAIGVALAGGTLGAFMYFGVHERIADPISFMPWIGCLGLHVRAGGHRGARPAADPAADTPADPQIPQSLTRTPYGRGVPSPTVPDDWLRRARLPQRRRPHLCWHPLPSLLALSIARPARATPTTVTTSRTSRSTSSSQIEQAQADAEESSQGGHRGQSALTQAEADLAAAQAQLASAQTEAAQVAAQLAEAEAVDAQMQAALDLARANLDPGQGRRRRRAGRPRRPAGAGQADRGLALPAGLAAADGDQRLPERADAGRPDPQDGVRRHASSTTSTRCSSQLHDAEVALQAKKDEVKTAEVAAADQADQAAQQLVTVQDLKDKADEAANDARPRRAERHRHGGRAGQGRAQGGAGEGRGPRRAGEAEEGGGEDQGGDPRRRRRGHLHGLRRRRRRLPAAAGARRGHLAVRLPRSTRSTATGACTTAPTSASPAARRCAPRRHGKVIDALLLRRLRQPALPRPRHGQRQQHHRGLQPRDVVHASTSATPSQRGDTVGYVGSTGWSTGCHLHFTVLEDGIAVDPMN